VICGKLLMYVMNKIGSRTQPYCTPVVISLLELSEIRQVYLFLNKK